MESENSLNRQDDKSGIANIERRAFVHKAAATAVAAAVPIAVPSILRAQQPLKLRFLTIPDPDGWHPSLRLKGDWLIFEVSDGVLSGFGEASHSREDERCKIMAAEVFEQHFAEFVASPGSLSLISLASKEAELSQLNPDFVTATAISGINQALYDLLAKREQVPVWQLFRSTTPLEAIPLYTTINRALQSRTQAEYLDVVGALSNQGFKTFKCAPFEAVTSPDEGLGKSSAGIAMLTALRERFPDLDVRVDFHERFHPEDFFQLLPEFEKLRLDWIEEPFGMGESFTLLRQLTRLRVAAGELFWAGQRFAEIAEHQWADVIMPDVKHVGGFGALLQVIERNAGRVEVSPHNPSGPVSTAASLHAAALYPSEVRSIEYAFDRAGTRARTGELVEGGMLYLSDAPGWGISPA